MEKQHNEIKGRTGLRRLRNAVIYSLDGYRAAWRDEEAFRQIVILLAAGIPLAFLLGRNWAETVLLVLPLVLCVIVELFNTAVENVVDRIHWICIPCPRRPRTWGVRHSLPPSFFSLSYGAGICSCVFSAS